MSLRILLTGKNGQIGHDLVPFLQQYGELTALCRAELELSNSAAIRNVLREVKPNLVVSATSRY